MLNKIIREEIVRFVNEDDIDYDFFEKADNVKQSLFDDFLFNNNEEFTKHVPWRVIPFGRLKKIWEDFMRYGFVRDEKGIDMIERIMINNVIKVNVFTELAGHTTYDPSDDYEEHIGLWIDQQLNCIFDKPFDKNQLEIPFDDPKSGYKEPENTSPCSPETKIHPFIQEFIEEKYNEESMDREDIKGMLMDEMTGRFFDYYMNDPEGKMGGFISDYGLDPLLKLLGQLMRQTKPEEKLVTIDRMLNVVHQRSDIASWFVEGGSRALSQLSGYSSPDEDSTISGNYKMSDYR
jgi:hypothetical protein